MAQEDGDLDGFQGRIFFWESKPSGLSRLDSIRIMMLNRDASLEAWITDRRAG
jgi:hypothetical protein